VLVAERVRVREIDDDEGQRLLRIIRRGSGSVVTWRRAQMVLLSAQGMPVAKIAEVTFTSANRVRDVIHNFNADGFDCLYPKYKGGRPRTFTLPERREIKKIAKSRPAEHSLPFSTWSLARLADFLVAEGVVDDISHEGLRVLLREEGVSFQRIKTWKTSRDPDYAAKKARVEHLYAIADGEVIPEDGEPEVVLCLDEFGPLNLHIQTTCWTTGRRAEDRMRILCCGGRPTSAACASRVKGRTDRPVGVAGAAAGRRRFLRGGGMDVVGRRGGAGEAPVA
jgi:transposase